MTDSLSVGRICPCSSPMRRPFSSSACSRTASSVADAAWTRSDPSTRGHTTKARCPAATSVRTLSQAASSSIAVRAHRVVIGVRPGGSSSMVVMSRSPNTTMAAVRGMGVAVITSRSGSAPDPSSPLPLARRAARCSTPKRCCSSMTTAPERMEPDLIGQQGMGPDHEVDSAVDKALVQAGPLGRRRLGRQEGDPERTASLQRGRVGNGKPVEQGSDPEEMLLGQDLGRGHQGALVATLHGDQQRGHRHHRLARTHVSLEQPVHREAGRPGRRRWRRWRRAAPRSAQTASWARNWSSSDGCPRPGRSPHGGCHGRRTRAAAGAAPAPAGGETARRRPGAAAPVHAAAIVAG